MNFTDKTIRYDIAFIIAVTALAIAAFSTALMPISSFDFWWHLNAGRYILEHGKIPQIDPFTFTALPDDPSAPGRPAFTFNNYWLSQVFYALTYGVAGLKGIILLRASTYMLIGLSAMALIRILGALRGGIVTLPLLVLCMRVALEDSDRPQNFTFLISLFVIVLIELAVNSKKSRLLYLTVPLMLLSSNLHGGYIVGLIYVFIYAGCSFFEERLKPYRRTLIYVAVLATAATYFNPGHWRVISYMMMKTNSEITSQVSEYSSPFSISAYVSGSPGWISYWILASVGAIAVVHHLAHKRFAWAVITAGTLMASLSSMRFIFFFAPVGAISAAIVINDLLGSRIKSRPIIESAALAFLLILILLRPAHQNNFAIRSELREMSFPLEAAAFVESSQLPQRVFSTIGWGGYLEWRLWPRRLMFIDTRELFKKPFIDYFEIMGYTVAGRKLLDEYRIGTVVIPALDPYSGQPYPLVSGLARDDRWALMYTDGQALVFARRGPGLTDEISKQNIYLEIISEADYWQPFAPWAAGSFAKTKADALDELRK